MEQLAQASPDLLHEVLGTLVNTLLAADADAVCVAQSRPGLPGPGESAQRVSASRLRHPAGTLDVAIPKLRQGSYLQAWLLERPRRAERALTSVVATCYLLGCRRRMDKLVQSVRITGLSLRSRTACNFLRTLRRAPFSDVCR